MLTLGGIGVSFSSWDLRSLAVHAATNAEAKQAEMDRLREERGEMAAVLRARAIASQAKRPREDTEAAVEPSEDDKIEALSTLLATFKRHQSLEGARIFSEPVAHFGAAAPAYSIDGNGKLNSAFGKLFALSAETVVGLQAELDSVHAQMTAEISVRSRTWTEPDGTVVVTAGPLPASLSQEYRTRFLAALESTLGETRYGMWKELVRIGPPNRSKPNSYFDSFGAENSQTVVVPQRPANGRQILYFALKVSYSPDVAPSRIARLNDRRATGNYSGLENFYLYPGGRVEEQAFGTRNRDEFLAFLGPTTRLLPADFPPSP